MSLITPQLRPKLLTLIQRVLHRIGGPLKVPVISRHVSRFPTQFGRMNKVVITPYTR